MTADTPSQAGRHGESLMTLREILECGHAVPLPADATDGDAYDRFRDQAWEARNYDR